MTCVTPSPESMTVPVSVRSDACFDVHDAASANTACIQTDRQTDRVSLVTEECLDVGRHLKVNITLIFTQYHSLHALIKQGQSPNEG